MTNNLEQNTIKVRLLTFIDSLKMPVSAFEKECGMSNATIQNIRSSIAPDKLQNIAEKFPQLNIEWLMVGRGDMLKTDKGDTVFSVSGDVIKDNYGRVYIRKDAHAEQTAQNELSNLSAENERLRKQVEEIKADKADLQNTLATLRKALEKFIG